MQWSSAPHAGFSTSTPWLPVSADYQIVNVDAQQKDRTSLLTLYRRLIQLRRAEPALNMGTYRPIMATEDMLVYTREAGSRRFLVALNLSGQPVLLQCAGRFPSGIIMISASLDREGERLTEPVAIRPDEGLVVLLDEEA